MAQIGKLADGHINHMVNTREIYRTLGVDVTRDYEVEDIIALGDKMPAAQVDEVFARVKATSKISRVSEEKVRDSVKMYLAIQKVGKRKQLQSCSIFLLAKTYAFKRDGRMPYKFAFKQ